MKLFLRVWMAFCVLALLGFNLTLAQAATKTWDGGSTVDSNWTTGANWDSDIAPVAGDSLVFAGTIRLDATNNFAANTNFAGITFNAGAGAFVLTGNAINLNSSITSNATTLQTINLPLALTAARTVTNSAGVTIGGVISGAFGLTKAGAGTLTLSGTNTYSGGTTLSAGVLNINADAALGAAPGTAATNITFSGSATLGATATFTLAATRNIAITASGTTASFNFDTSTLTIPGVISGAGGIAKLGTGTLQLSGNNTFTGAVAFTGVANSNVGNIRLASSTALGPDATSKTINMSAIQGTASGAIELVGGVTINNKNITLAGRTVTASGAQLRNVSGNNAFNGNLTPSNTGGGYAVNLAAGTLSLGGTIQNAVSTGPRGLTFNGAGNAILTGVTQDGATASTNLTQAGTGTITVTGTNTYSGGTTISAGTVQVGNGGASGTLGTGAITNAATLAFNRSDTFTFDNDISGAGTVTQTGAGTTILSGTNTYTGQTIANAGVLQATAPNSLGTTSRLTVNDGTFLFVSLSVPATAQTLTLSNLTLTDGSTIGAGLGNTPGTSDVIAVTNAAKANGTVSVKPVVIAGATPSNVSYDLVTDSSGGLLNTSTSSASYILAPPSTPNVTFSLIATDNAVSVTPSVATPAPVLYWKGGLVAPFNSWIASDGTTTNWTTDAAGTQISSAVPTSITDVILSADGATNQGNMVLGTDFSIKSLTINDPAAVVINPGSSLTISPSGSIGTTGVTINAGAGAATLNPSVVLGSGQTWTNSSGNLLTVGGAISNGANLLTTAGSGDMTFGGTLGNGAGGLTKTGSGTLTLSAANSYTGATTISAGILNIRTATGLGTVAGGTSVASGSTLQLQGGLAVGAEPLVLNGAGFTGQNGSLVSVSGVNTYGGAITLGSNSTASVDISGAQLILGGAVTGPTFDLTLNAVAGSNGYANGVIGTTTGGVNKTGAGNWQFTNANTYTGPTNVSGGLLELKRTTQTSIASASNVTVSSGASVQITDHAGGGQLPYANNFTLNGNGINGTGALGFYNSANFSVTGPITLASDATVRTDPAGQTTPITFAGVISGAGQLTLSSQNSPTNAGTSTGSPIFILTGANTYTGGTLLTSGTTSSQVFLVTLSGGNDRLPVGTTATFGGTPAGATGSFNKNVSLQLGGINQTIAGLQVASGATGSYNVAGSSATLSTLTVNNATPYTFSGLLGGTGTNNNNLALTKTGTGPFIVSGVNTYTGATTVNGGTLQLGASNRLANGSNMFVGGGTFATGGFDETVGTLALTDTSSIDLGAGTSTLTYANSSAVAWTADKTLAILNYTSGTDHLFVGTSASGLTASQLAQIKFNLGALVASATQLSTGEVVPNLSVVISELRFSGPGGDLDEFIELVNPSASPIDLSGWTLTAGTTPTALSGIDFTGKTIPAKGHLLLTNSGGYSLSSAASGDVSYTGDIAPASTLTLSNAASTVVDTVGNLSAIAAPSASTNQYAYVRRLDSGIAADSGNDSADFNLVDTSATISTTDASGVGPMTAARLGAPGPQNIASPIARNGSVELAPLAIGTSVQPTTRYVSRGSTIDTKGRMGLRRTLKNNTGATVNTLRFRIVGGTTGTSNTASGVADLRAISSAGVRYYGSDGTTILQATVPVTLDAPSSPTEAPLTATSGNSGKGGGLNSSWTVALPSGGLAPGASVGVEFLFGIVADGNYRIVLDSELLP